MNLDQRRWCIDWLLQFCWAIENEVEQLTNLYVPPRSSNPVQRGVLDTKDDKLDTELAKAHPMVPYMPQPEVWAYTCYIPQHDALEFHGARVWLYPEGMREIVSKLTRAQVFALWHQYAQGGTYQVWYFHRTHGSMQLTPKARAVVGIEKVGEVLFEHFEKQLLQDENRRKLENANLDCA